MRNVFKLALLLVTACTCFGCAHNYYSIPQETLEKKVKTVGVAPFFTDDANIKHPEKGAIGTLIQGHNAKNQKELIARMRGTNSFYAVRQVDGDPSTLFSKLVANKERRDDAGIIYNKYFYKKDELTQLMSENGLDAILMVTVSGLTRPGKVYASNLLSYLESDFDYLAMSAQLIDREGSVIWEYPNFRRSVLSYPMFFSLQYPDFDEAAANLTEKVDVKFKTVPGITAAFAQTESSAANGPPVSTLYVKQYDEMLSLLKKERPLPLFGGKPAEAPAAAPEAPAAPAAPATAPAAAPAAAPVGSYTSLPAAPVARAEFKSPYADPLPATAKDVKAEVLPNAGDIVAERPITSADIK